MLTISVELLHGTLRAASPDGIAWAQGEPRGEWPPSPARLFSALVAGAGTRDRCPWSSGDDLLWLERLEAPVIYASALTDVEMGALLPRYVVVDQTSEKPGAVQDYPARRAIAVRPGVRLSPRNRIVHYVWPDVQPGDETFRSLQARTARVGYLGCSDSPVRVRVSRESVQPGLDQWVPDHRGLLSLPIPYPGFTQNLDDSFDRWSAGESAERSWIRTVRSSYREPGSEKREVLKTAIPIWLRLERGLAGKRLVVFTATLRAAVTDHLQRLLPAGANVPSVIHGHRQSHDSEEQACFLGLPNVGNEHADGRLLGAAILLPSSTDKSTVQLVRSAIYGLTQERLVKPGWFDLALSLYAGDNKPYSSHPARWSGPAARWYTASPVVFERWTKGAPDLDEVARWCNHAGLPAPVAAGFRRAPELEGALDLHPDDVTRPGRERRPYSHMWVEFGSQVRGPVVLGRGRYLGLGLMVPVHGLDGR